MNVSYAVALNTATFTFPGFPGGRLPDGNYQALIAGSGITDVAGNPIADYSTSFFFLGADANHDRSVDLSDFTILASNFNVIGRDFSQGDFNYDTKVDLTDFTMLASKFNTNLTPPPPAPSSQLSRNIAP